MSTFSEMSDEQFTQLVSEYHAPAEKRQMLTNAESNDIAKRLNDKIDIPIITEGMEQKVLLKIVLKVDRFLYDHLPNEFYDFVRSADHGIDDAEAEKLLDRLSKLANQKIDIPYLPEQMEYLAIHYILSVIINAARNSWDIKKANDAGL